MISGPYCGELALDDGCISRREVLKMNTKVRDGLGFVFIYADAA